MQDFFQDAVNGLLSSRRITELENPRDIVNPLTAKVILVNFGQAKVNFRLTIC